jgi:uncharacterized protein YjbI with pentapeptide repeats
LIDSGLIQNAITVQKLRSYIETRKAGEGVSLPISSDSGARQNYHGRLAAAIAAATGPDQRRNDLSGADFGNSNLNGYDFTDANLMDASLRGALLIRADLTRANLSRAILRGADLSGANLFRANLTDADLSDVVGLTPAQLERACGKPAALPVGFTLNLNRPC